MAARVMGPAAVLGTVLVQADPVTVRAMGPVQGEVLGTGVVLVEVARIAGGNLLL